jgi:hypothetical protein
MEKDGIDGELGSRERREECGLNVVIGHSLGREGDLDETGRESEGRSLSGPDSGSTLQCHGWVIGEGDQMWGREEVLFVTPIISYVPACTEASHQQRTERGTYHEEAACHVSTQSSRGGENHRSSRESLQLPSAHGKATGTGSLMMIMSMIMWLLL